MTKLVTGQFHLEAHLFKMGLVNSPSVTDIKRHPEQPHMFLVTVKLHSHSGVLVEISCNEETANLLQKRHKYGFLYVKIVSNFVPLIHIFTTNFKCISLPLCWHF